MEKQKVIGIVGPTASGKTDLAVYLARKFNGEVISADSRQIYRDMDIIAAIPSTDEMRGVPHHMLRRINPSRQYSAGEFVREGEKLLEQIQNRQRVPIVAGGTGLYADSLLRGWSLPEVEPNKKLRAQLEKKTAAQLFSQLKRLDPRRAENIDCHNPVRLIRAIEIAKSLGCVPLLIRNSSYKVLWLGIAPERELHKKAIHKRIQVRLKLGMIAEAKKLRKRLSKKRFAALGIEFKLINDFLEKKITRKELIERLESWENGYVRRQMRWLRRNGDINWIKNKTEASTLVRQFLQ